MPPLQDSCTHRVPACERLYALVFAEPYDCKAAESAVRELWELGDRGTLEMPPWEARLFLAAACAMTELDCRALIEEDDYNWGPDIETLEAWEEWPEENHPDSLLERIRTLRRNLAELELGEEVHAS